MLSEELEPTYHSRQAAYIQLCARSYRVQNRWEYVLSECSVPIEDASFRNVGLLWSLAEVLTSVPRDLQELGTDAKCKRLFARCIRRLLGNWIVPEEEQT
jgi:hypothetical protein